MKNKKGLILFTCILVVVSLFLGCASIVSGTRQEINFSSSPSNASVAIKTTNGMVLHNVTTPAVLALKRNQNYIISVNLPGYQETQAFINRDLNGWFLGNIIFGGLLGVVIDVADGAMWRLTPDQVYVQLVTVMNDNNQMESFAQISYMDKNSTLRTTLTPLIKK